MQALLKIKGINDTLTQELEDAKKSLAQSSQEASNANKAWKVSSEKLSKAENEIAQLLEQACYIQCDMGFLLMRCQVEAATGAEEMVETLTDQNLELEMRVRELEEACHAMLLLPHVLPHPQENTDLTSLVDMNDQIEEDHQALERQLRQDVDMAGSLLYYFLQRLC